MIFRAVFVNMAEMVADVHGVEPGSDSGYLSGGVRYIHLFHQLFILREKCCFR